MNATASPPENPKGGEQGGAGNAAAAGGRARSTGAERPEPTRPFRWDLVQASQLVPPSVRDYLLELQPGVTALVAFTQGGPNVRLAIHSDGSRSVVKWISVEDRPAVDVLRSASLVRHLADSGWPVPTIREVADLGDFTLSREDFSLGEHPSDIAAPVVLGLIHLSRSSPEMPAEAADWSDRLLGNLYGADPKIRRDVLEASSFGRRTLEAATRAMAASDFRGLPCAVVHGDLSPGNVLLSTDGSISAVVDWEGVTVGDPAFDLVTLEWDLELWGRSVRHLLPILRDELSGTSSAATRRVYRLYLSCRNLTWSAGSEDEAQVVATARRVLALE